MLQGKYFYELCYKGNIFMSYVTREIFYELCYKGDIFMSYVTREIFS
jgi:hypothetical protein